MVAIHPIAWLVTGIIVTLVSWMVGAQLQVFFYLGLAFFTYGLFRVLLIVMTRTKEDRETIKDIKRHEKQVRTICFFCKKDVHEGDAFCRHCGARLR